MYRAIRYLFFGFYWHFFNSKSSKIIAYESALMAFSLFLYMNILSVFVFFGIRDLGIVSETDSYWDRWIKTALIVCLPLMSILWLLFPKRMITQLDYGEELNRGSRFFMVLYCVVSFIVIIVAIN